LKVHKVKTHPLGKGQKRRKRGPTAKIGKNVPTQKEEWFQQQDELREQQSKTKTALKKTGESLTLRDKDLPSPRL